MPSPLQIEHGHSTSEIRERLAEGGQVNYLRDWVYGGIDGAVTTFAVVAGVTGADLSARVILVLGGANLLADGFSMAASNFSGTKTEHDDQRRLREMERRHIRITPEGEREEVREIFRAKGFEGDDLERAVEIITSREERWVDTMLAEEFGLATALRSPIVAALCTFAAFLLCGTVPLVPYLAVGPDAFAVSTAATALVFFAIGAVKSAWSTAPWWLSGLETLAIGLAAAALAYGAGVALERWM